MTFGASQIFDQTSQESRSLSTFQDSLYTDMLLTKRAHVCCARINTCTRTTAPGPTLILPWRLLFIYPHFLLCLLEGSLRYPRSSLSSPMAPDPPFLWNRAQSRGWHTGPNQTVSSPSPTFSLEDRPMGLTGNRGGR